MKRFGAETLWRRHVLARRHSGAKIFLDLDISAPRLLGIVHKNVFFFRNTTTKTTCGAVLRDNKITKIIFIHFLFYCLSADVTRKKIRVSCKIRLNATCNKEAP